MLYLMPGLGLTYRPEDYKDSHCKKLAEKDMKIPFETAVLDYNEGKMDIYLILDFTSC